MLFEIFGPHVGSARDCVRPRLGTVMCVRNSPGKRVEPGHDFGGRSTGLKGALHPDRKLNTEFRPGILASMGGCRRTIAQDRLRFILQIAYAGVERQPACQLVDSVHIERSASLEILVAVGPEIGLRYTFIQAAVIPPGGHGNPLATERLAPVSAQGNKARERGPWIAGELELVALANSVKELPQRPRERSE